jgi:hypothetical protein
MAMVLLIIYESKSKDRSRKANEGEEAGAEARKRGSAMRD